MCNCKGTEQLGDYSRMSIIDTNHGRIQVDKCLEEEIKFLNDVCNIKTIQSCCGHNQVEGWIAVSQDDIERMIDLGYEHYKHPFYSNAEEFFKPKY